jgi:hypothetical protein
MPTLAEQFIVARGASLHVNGCTVVNMYRRPVGSDQKVKVSARPAVEQPVQGLRIKLVDGLIQINDQFLKEIVIWFDNAPPNFEFSCHPKKQITELRIWNCWRDSRGGVQSWIGNAGMIAEEEDSDVVLRCSTGIADFEPQQLIVNLKF